MIFELTEYETNIFLLMMRKYDAIVWISDDAAARSMLAWHRATNFPELPEEEDRQRWVNVFSNPGANRSILVECAGVNATVLSSDIGVTDGVVHIIDRVLGAPSHSLGWKLQNEEPLAWVASVSRIDYCVWSIPHRSHIFQQKIKTLLRIHIINLYSYHSLECLQHHPGCRDQRSLEQEAGQPEQPFHSVRAQQLRLAPDRSGWLQSTRPSA